MGSTALLCAALLAALLMAACGDRGGEEPEPGGELTATRSIAPVDLEAGGDVIVDMGAAQVRSFRIKAAAGEFVRINADQEGVDVLLILFDSRGRELSRVDSPTGATGRETLALIADSASTYTVEVRPFAAEKASGRVRIHRSEGRQASGRDRHQVAAERAYTRARRLAGRSPAADRRRAEELFLEALERFRLAEDRRGEALSLKELGGLAYAGDRLHEALDLYAEALALFKELGDEVQQGILLNSMGPIYRRWGRFNEASECYLRALEIAESHGDEAIEEVAVHNTAALYRQQGKLEEALKLYRQVRQRQQARGSFDKEAAVLASIGAVYLDFGEPARALDALRQADQIAREYKLPEIRVRALELRSRAYRRLGQPAAARRDLEEALPLARELRQGEEEAFILNGLGLVYPELGDDERARERFLEALAIFRRLDSRRDEAAVLLNLGWLHHRSRQWDRSLELHQESLALFERLGDVEGVASSRYGAARALVGMGRLRQALRSIEASLEGVEDLRGRLAVDLHRASFFATKQSYYDFYIDLLLRLHEAQPRVGFDGLAFAASERRRARSLLDLLAESGTDLLQGLDPTLLEQEQVLRGRLQWAEAERISRAVLPSHDPRRAEAEERVEELLSQYELLEGEIRSRSPRYAALTAPPPLTLEEVQEDLLDGESQLLAYSLGEERSFLWLIDRQGIRTYVLAARGEIEAHVRRLQTLLSRSWTTEAQGQALLLAAKVSEMLLGPAADELRARRLLLIKDGALHYLPFAALPLPGRTVAGPEAALMIDDYEIVTLPSASVVAEFRSRQRGAAPPPGTVAVIGDPVFGPEDPRARQPTPDRGEGLAGGAGGEPSPAPPVEPHWAFDRLTFSGEEVRDIASLVPPGTALEALGFEATRDLVLSGELGGYRYIHFATHGLVNAEQPRLSGIVLSLLDEGGKPRNGFLSLQDIYNLDLAADLVSVSSCQSALGKEVRGEGLVGLTRGFMYAGVPRVMVSLWDVSDRATSELMVHFYRGILDEGLRPAAALRAAQLALKAEPTRRAPYYWAAFVLQGEWR